MKGLLEAATRKNKWIPVFKNYPTVPKIDRDINFIINRKYLINEIIATIKKSGKNLLEEASLLDKYCDESIGKENVSYTFRLSYRDKEKTLQDEDISHIHENIIKNIEAAFCTSLRK